MPQIFINNARGVLAASVPSGETILSLKNGAHLPATLAAGDWFLMTLFNDASRYGSNIEVVKVTAITDDGGGNYTLTVERGYEGDAIVHASGEKVEARITAQTLRTLLEDAKAYTDDELTALLDSAPGALDTLNELAAALGDDPNFAATMTDALAAKLDSTSYTAADVLAKLLTVDGEGSGLVADTLRGDTPGGLRDRSTHTGTQPLSTISDAGTAASEDAVTGENDGTASRLTTNARLDIWVRDKERQQLEAASGGLCTIERTTNGQACHMFVLPKTRWEDLLPGQDLGTGVHEAFLENGVEKSEILLGMYQAANLNGELVSQPGLAPQRSIDWDQSNSDAQAAGFNLFGNWEWSAVAFWCMANGYQPTGNTDNGRSHSDPYQRGILGLDSVDNTATGSGPNAWNHNNAANGIADLVGNVWEWQWGFKMVDGRIFIAPDNDRSLSESGWADSGYDLPSDANPWSSLTQAGATQQVQRALIVPNGVSDPDGRLYANLTGERFPIRGGSRSSAASAGLGALFLILSRGNSGSAIGLRLSRLV